MFSDATVCAQEIILYVIFTRERVQYGLETIILDERSVLVIFSDIQSIPFKMGKDKRKNNDDKKARKVSTLHVPQSHTVNKSLRQRRPRKLPSRPIRARRKPRQRLRRLREVTPRM